jgi:protein-tyrosine phosphatase
VIDFHTHILHQIDDGARSLEEAVMMARIAVEDGITTIVATPHSPLSRQGQRYSVELVHQRLDELRAVLQQEHVPLDVQPGTELRYHADLLLHLQAELVLPCGAHRALLIECPNSHLPQRLEETIFRLQVEGYTVVIAHPERIRTVQKDPGVLIPLIERNVLMQLTAGALIGAQGRRMQRLAEMMVTHSLIHLLASDAHSASSIRSPQLATACAHAARLVGEQTARAMVQCVPAALLAGRSPKILPPKPVNKKKRHWFWFW